MKTNNDISNEETSYIEILEYKEKND